MPMSLACGSYTPLCCSPRPASAGLSGQGLLGHAALAEDSVAPTVSLTDDGYKIVFSRLGQRLRIAGTAEFNGYNTELNAVRCARP
jgi:D-amino-acid dehydrogenase